jgi:class 3 adenylate cyclase
LNGLGGRKASAAEKVALTELARTLLLFTGQANPILRPIAREYQQIAALLARGKRRGIAKRLTRLQSTREKLAARMTEVDDYMNWFEATQLPAFSGLFADYLRAARQPQATGPRRWDPISVYLDALEDQFGD